jgi:hypothetical protein
MDHLREFIRENELVITVEQTGQFRTNFRSKTQKIAFLVPCRTKTTCKAAFFLVGANSEVAIFVSTLSLKETLLDAKLSCYVACYVARTGNADIQ